MASVNQLLLPNFTTKLVKFSSLNSPKQIRRVKLVRLVRWLRRARLMKNPRYFVDMPIVSKKPSNWLLIILKLEY